MKNGKYLKETLAVYGIEDTISYKCDFGPKDFVGVVQCGVDGWNRKPFCPEKELKGITFPKQFIKLIIFIYRRKQFLVNH